MFTYALYSIKYLKKYYYIIHFKSLFWSFKNANYNFFIKVYIKVSKAQQIKIITIYSIIVFKQDFVWFCILHYKSIWLL